jgi:activator of 2-hydroxyglutaryl-CoA dehydratase
VSYGLTGRRPFGLAFAHEVPNGSGLHALGINSTCAVFAESEAIGLIAGGRPRSEIAARVIVSIAGSAAAVRRVGGSGPVIFQGGVARCVPLREALEAPQSAVALGCALIDGETAA